MSTAIKLSPRRLDQLKAIGAALNLSVTEVIATMIRREIAAGTIPDMLPGIVIKKVKTGVQVTIDDAATKTLPHEGAHRLVATIREVLEGQAPTVNLDYGFAVLRRGSGIKIAVPFPGVEHAFSPDLARDFARLIEEAAG